MKRALRHITRLAAAFCLLLAAWACDKEALSSADEPAENGKAVLVLNAQTAGATRAAAVSDNEKIHTLRIVILHSDGTVEHNEHINFGTAPVTQYTRFIPVTMNETKAVYLFANEETMGVSATLDAFAPGANGFQTTVEGLTFKSDFTTGNIPMTSKYNVEVKQETVEHQFYLVHAATKFTFRFRNTRTGAVTLQRIGVSSVADEMYVMPRKINQTMDFREPDGVTLTPLYWVDWLQRVAEESEANPDNPLNTQLAEGRGWIMDYDIPAGVTHRTAEFTDINKEVPVTSVDGDPMPVLSFYLPESRNLKTPGAGSYTEQAYTMEITLEDNYNKTKKLTAEFKNLKALFRNTHVVTNVLLGETMKVELQYTVCPWLVYNVDVPTFE